MRISSTAAISLSSAGLFLIAVSACRGDESESVTPTTTPTTITGTGGGTTTTTSDGGSTTTTTTSGGGTTTTTTTSGGGSTTTATGTGGAGGSTPEETAHLVISEVRVTPNGAEFVEIYNGTGASIDLSDYYLTDATYAGGATYYYNIATGTNAGGGSFGDFHARFPDGATIADGAYQVIAINGSDAFATAYPGVVPTYELFEDAGTPDAVPDMREATAASIEHSDQLLTNNGEVVVLYHWDGATDLVQDADYVLWGDKEEGVDKTGIAIDGPDGDSNTSAYAADTAIATQAVVFAQMADLVNAKSLSRIDYFEGMENTGAGNGISGHDETSENLGGTFAQRDPSPGRPTSAQ